MVGGLRNLQYDAVYSSSYSSTLLARSYYDQVWNSQADGIDHKSSYAIDNIVDNSQAAGNWRSKAGFQKPWLEIHLTSEVTISGLEVTSYGFEDKKRFRKVIMRAGLVPSPVAKGEGGNDLLTHNPFIFEYSNHNSQGEIIYLNFPQPLAAKYILLQGNDKPAARFPTDSVVLELAEVRVIQGEWCVEKVEADDTVCSALQWMSCQGQEVGNSSGGGLSYGGHKVRQKKFHGGFFFFQKNINLVYFTNTLHEVGVTAPTSVSPSRLARGGTGTPARPPAPPCQAPAAS